MTSLECAETQEHAPEFALGILTGGARAELVAHLEHCHACAASVADFAEIVDGLTLIAPEAEPPVGFEDHVLRAMHEQRRPIRRKRRLLLTLALLVVGVIAFTVATIRVVDGVRASEVPTRAADVRANNAVVGKGVVVSGEHPWVFLSIEGGLPDARYRASVVDLQGETILVGEFDVVAGRGSWTVPEAKGLDLVREIRVLNPEGNEVARAVFRVT